MILIFYDDSSRQRKARKCSSALKPLLLLNYRICQKNVRIKKHVEMKGFFSNQAGEPVLPDASRHRKYHFISLSFQMFRQAQRDLRSQSVLIVGLSKSKLNGS